MRTAIHTRVVGALTFTSSVFLNRNPINKQDLAQLRTLNARSGHTPSTIPRLRMYESSGHFALAVLREWSITCSKYFLFDHFCRSSLPRAEQSMCKVLSALSAGCDSALSRNGWDALNLVQPGEPMWKPSSKRLLRLKPLLIARTPLNGTLITVIFYSKKVPCYFTVLAVFVINHQAICPRCLQEDGILHAMTCLRPRLPSTRANHPMSWPTTQTSLESWLSTTSTSRITMPPERRRADDVPASLYCGEIPDAERLSTLTCATPQLPTSCPLEVQEELGLTGMTLVSTPQLFLTNGMEVEVPFPNFFNGQTPPPCM